MAKLKKNQKVNTKTINVHVTNNADKEILEKAICLLDKQGYTICRKDSFVIDNELIEIEKNIAKI